MDEDDEAGAGRGAPSPNCLPAIREGKSGSNVVPFPAPPKPLRRRHDGFTAAKQKKFLRALKKSGCLKDAAGAAGISTNTIRRHRDKWPEFDDKVESALAIASVELDMVAWKRATEGSEEKVYRNGELVFTRVKPSDMLLKMLVEGADPKKYGRGQTMPKRAVMKKLKKQADAEARARLRVGEAELTEELLRLLAVLERRQAQERLARGYAIGPDGKLESPG